MTPEERQEYLNRALRAERQFKIILLIGFLVVFGALFWFVPPLFNKYERMGFVRAEVISVKMAENDGPSRLLFLVRVQDGTLYRANTKVFALRASEGDFVCIELRKRGWTSVLRAVVVVEKHCAGLPPLEPAN